MLLNAKIIGLGAAGNKAAIALDKKYPEITKDMVLINSTMKDIPMEYREKAVQLDGTFRGCAKERKIANEMMKNTLQNGTFDYIGQDGESMAIIVTSSEGGTGSGASELLAQYISQVYNVPVHFFIFTGFEDDARGLKNTVDLFSSLSDKYIVESISNRKFLDEANGNRLKAEALANEAFADKVNILLGGTIQESEQNIDESDLKKITTLYPGFMQIETIDLDKIKNIDDFNKRIISVLDTSSSLAVEPTCKAMATILNMKEKNLDFVDYDFSVLKKRFGIPFEKFSHIQSTGTSDYLQIIIAGLKMPIDDIQEVYNEFINRTDSVDKTKDDFFGKNFQTDVGQFDTLGTTNQRFNVNAAKASFFSKKEGSSSVVNEHTQDTSFKNIKQNPITIDKF